ncbi:MAG: hypothetical protein CSA65_09810 [Proteobacteria bacterium]|nr:MAG: hypothetical protein CSA65_09810 [Pseudomonadota bacterium]
MGSVVSHVWVNIVVALGEEAAPLARAFGLRARWSGGQGVALYEGAICGLATRLMVGGVGRSAAATAVGLLRGLAIGDERGSRSLWLSGGLAGHRARPLGQVVLAATVHDATRGRRFELLREFATPCAVADLETHDEVVHAYPLEDRAVEMEAAGFVAAARRLGVSRGRVQCLKVISDNARAPLRKRKPRLTRAQIEGYVARLVPALGLLLPRWEAALRSDDADG